MDNKTIITDRSEVNKYISGHDTTNIVANFRKDLQNALLKECTRLDAVIESTKCGRTTHDGPCEPCLKPSTEIVKFSCLTESLENFLQKNIMNMLKEIRNDLKGQLDRNGISYEASYDHLKKDA